MACSNLAIDFQSFLGAIYIIVSMEGLDLDEVLLVILLPFVTSNEGEKLTFGGVLMWAATVGWGKQEVVLGRVKQIDGDGTVVCPGSNHVARACVNNFVFACFVFSAMHQLEVIRFNELKSSVDDGYIKVQVDVLMTVTSRAPGWCGQVNGTVITTGQRQVEVVQERGFIWSIDA